MQNNTISVWDSVLFSRSLLGFQQEVGSRSPSCWRLSALSLPCGCCGVRAARRPTGRSATTSLTRSCVSSPTNWSPWSSSHSSTTLWPEHHGTLHQMKGEICPTFSLRLYCSSRRAGDSAWDVTSTNRPVRWKVGADRKRAVMLNLSWTVYWNHRILHVYN